jgi:hypothetical protein
LLCQHRAINLLIRCALARIPKMEERCVIEASPSFVFARLRRSCYRMGMLVPRSRLARDLEKLGLEPDGVTMVHCRMSALGYVVGGAETVVRALQDAVGPGGTLMAYTGWQDEPPDDLDAWTRRRGGSTSKSIPRTILASRSRAATTDGSPKP